MTTISSRSRRRGPEAVTALVAAATLAFAALLAIVSDRAEAAEKPRVIITQDGEVDDMDSFIRYLYYSNEFDTAGIVYTSSTFHYAGNGADVAPFRWTGTSTTTRRSGPISPGTPTATRRRSTCARSTRSATSPTSAR